MLILLDKEDQQKRLIQLRHQVLVMAAVGKCCQVLKRRCKLCSFQKWSA
jgi:hypothetical protein